MDAHKFIGYLPDKLKAFWESASISRKYLLASVFQGKKVSADKKLNLTPVPMNQLLLYSRSKIKEKAADFDFS